MEAQTEGATEKDESVRRTSWSWPGGPGRAATLRTQKKRGGREDKKKKSCFSKDHLGIFLHLNSGDGTRGPTSEWGSLLTLHDNRLPAADRVCFQLVPTVSGNSRTNRPHLLWIKMPKEGLTA